MSIINIDAVLPYFTRMPLSSLGLGRCCHWWRWSARSCVLCYCLLVWSVGRFLRLLFFFAFVIIVFSCLFVSKKNSNSFNPQNDPRQRGKPKHLPSVLRDDMTAGWRWWWWRSFVIASVAASTHVWLQCFSLRFMRFVLLLFSFCGILFFFGCSVRFLSIILDCLSSMFQSLYRYIVVSVSCPSVRLSGCLSAHNFVKFVFSFH